MVNIITTNIMSQAAESYIENYNKLKQIAKTIAETDEPDIDQLVSLIADATEAYKNCQARIEAVEKACSISKTSATV
jgi:exodeoxyribonuclease VII small subunit